MGVARMNPRKRRAAIEQASNNTKAEEVAQVGGGSGGQVDVKRSVRKGSGLHVDGTDAILFIYSFLSRAWPGQIT